MKRSWASSRLGASTPEGWLQENVFIQPKTEGIPGARGRDDDRKVSTTLHHCEARLFDMRFLKPRNLFAFVHDGSACRSD